MYWYKDEKGNIYGGFDNVSRVLKDFVEKGVGYADLLIGENREKLRRIDSLEDGRLSYGANIKGSNK